MHKYFFTAVAAALLLSAAPVIAASERSATPKRSVADATWIRASNKHTDFIAFTESGQALSNLTMGTGKAALRAVAGTVISTDGGQTVLHNGCIRIDGQKGEVTVGSRLFAVSVPAGASALVESFPAIRLFRIVDLSAPANAVVTVRFKQSRLPVRLAAGEAVSTEGGDHPSSATKFDQKTFFEPNPSDEVLLADAVVNTVPAVLKALGGTEFKCMSNGVIAIRNGEFLAQSASPLDISGPSAHAISKKGSLIDVEAYTGDFRVKALSGPGHVTVLVGEQTVPVNPGQELFLTRRVIEDSDLTPPDGVGRRRFDRMTLKDGTKGVMSDFSILSFLGAAEHMQSLRHSTRPEDHAAAERILKTAAAVQSLTAASGPYKSVVRSTRRRNPSRETGPSA